MDSSRLKRIMSIVDTAISLKPEKRPGYLTDICGDDESLKQEVLELLESIDKSEAFWEGWQDWNDEQIEILLQDDDDVSETPESEYVGSWHLKNLLGRGGMGNVYLAERADGQYEQNAALKIIKHGLEFGESARRFLQERQILAQLDHPNIARFYDGGVTGDGRPWLAMQYVDGTPITTWCKQRESSLPEQLKLFENVCEAVRYAHRNLIVHRDLKPDNILVSTNGTVKVLDFGIAKLIDHELSPSDRIQTQTGMRVMSLDYAAPEQIVGEAVTTATDVYTLGLLLYELLTGSYPFELKGKNRREIEKVLRDQDLPKPSSKSNRWSSELKGDLDAITLKALRKEPDQRYENAGQLLDDLRRHQNNLPVIAHNDTFRYRLSKFRKRHAQTLILSSAAVITIIALIFYYTTQLKTERNEARLQASKAEQVSAFLTDLFKASDPRNAMGETVTADDLLERGSQKIEETLNDEPATKAALYEVLGTVHTNLGKYDKAQSQFEEALKLRRRALDPLHPDIAKNLNEISTALIYQGNSQSARATLLEALALHEQADEPNYENYASTLNNLAALYLRGNNPDSAEVMLRHAIDIRREHVPDDSLQLATNLEGLAMTLERKGNTEEAETLYRESLAIKSEKLEEYHPDLARSYNNLAGFMLRRAELEEAEPLYRQAMEIWKKVHGDDHPDVATVSNNLAAVLERKGELDAAETYYRESLSIKRKLLDSNHLSLSYTLSNLGLLLIKKENYSSAEPLILESLDIRRSNFSEPHSTVAKGIGNLAHLYKSMGQAEKAIPYYREELAMRNEITPLDSVQIMQAEIGLGSSLAAVSKFEEAESLLLKNYTELTSQSPIEEDAIRFIRQNLIEMYTEWEKPDLASLYQPSED